MKKALALMIAAVMTAGVLAGCGGDTSKKSGSAGTGGKTNTEEKGDTKEAAELKVGVIHITDPAEGSGYTYTHDIGIQDMQKNLGLSDGQIVRKNNVNDSDPTAIENAIRECIEEGCNLIFGTSWGYMDTMDALAAEFPDVIFSHGTGYKSNDENFNNYFGRIYQARYLSGIAAGLKTETNKLGYVAAMGVDNSEVTGGADAFAMGVFSVNPDAKVYIKVTNSWFNPEAENAAAQSLVDIGCDVIAQHCDTPNPQTVAQKAGVFGVGYNSDMSKDAPDATLTSVIWHWGVYYTAAAKAVMDGTWEPVNYFGGLKEGLVDIAPLSDFCAEGTAEKIEEAKAKMLDGSFNVFDGVIETNDGSTVGENGKTLEDAEIKGGINWYFKNIVSE